MGFIAEVKDMTLKEILAKIGIDLDSEIDEGVKPGGDESGTSNKKDEPGKDDKKDEPGGADKKDKASGKKTTEDEKNTVEDEVMDLSNIVFNEETLKFETKGVKDEGLKALFEKVNAAVDNREKSYKINTAIDNKLSTVKIRNGITADAVKTLLDKTNITLNEKGEVVGLDEAFDALTKSQAGLFVQRQSSESNPILEGFAPAGQDSRGTGLDGALADFASSIINTAE